MAASPTVDSISAIPMIADYLPGSLVLTAPTATKHCIYSGHIVQNITMRHLYHDRQCCNLFQLFDCLALSIYAKLLVAP